MIYFCIPTHDEAATIGLVLWKIRRVLEDSPREYHLLVGDSISVAAGVDTTHRRVPPYRPTNRDPEHHNAVRIYNDNGERVFVGVMFTGVFLNAVS